MEEVKTFIGIDPGKSGGIVFLDQNGNIQDVLDIKKNSEQDLNYFLSIYNNQTQMCVIEKVHSFPGQGVTSTFTFGENFGMLQGLVIGNKIPHELFTPRQWQKEMRIKKKQKSESKTDFKRRLKGEAQRLFPNEKVINNTADAYLIAEFCRRKFGSVFEKNLDK